jgi:hypothetical protein
MTYFPFRYTNYPPGRPQGCSSAGDRPGGKVGDRHHHQGPDIVVRPETSIKPLFTTGRTGSAAGHDPKCRPFVLCPRVSEASARGHYHGADAHSRRACPGRSSRRGVETEGMAGRATAPAGRVVAGSDMVDAGDDPRALAWANTRCVGGRRNSACKDGPVPSATRGLTNGPRPNDRPADPATALAQL